jgi:hypothetical protein
MDGNPKTKEILKMRAENYNMNVKELFRDNAFEIKVLQPLVV